MDKGQKTDQDNFRSDVNASGRITKSDIAAHPATTGYLIAVTAVSAT